MSLTDRFIRWFDYETDVHAKVVASLGTVPEDKRGDAAYQKALDVLAHIASARSLWLFRFGVAETGPDSAEELFHEAILSPMSRPSSVRCTRGGVSTSGASMTGSFRVFSSTDRSKVSVSKTASRTS